MTKLDCWEFKKCGREPGGSHVHDMGVCPAVDDVRLDGVHEGKKVGRACRVLTGTLCSGEIHGTFAQKYDSCARCDFYRKVREEEHPRFHLAGNLLKNLWKRYIV